MATGGRMVDWSDLIERCTTTAYNRVVQAILTGSTLMIDKITTTTW